MQLEFFYIANIRIPTEKAHGLQIMKTCEALVSQGTKVKLLVPERVNRLQDNPFEFYNVPGNFSIKKLWCLDLINLPFLKKLFFWLESFTFYLSVNKYLKENVADMYYTRDLSIAFWLSKKINIFYEIHTLPDRPKKRHICAWKRSKALVVISQGLKRDLIKNGVDEKKIIVAPDAVDIKNFKTDKTKEQSREKFNLDPHDKIVLYTGHLYDWKGANLLAEAAKYLSEVEVYLVGGTEEDIAKYKSNFNFKNLHIVGWQSHELMPEWLNAADILVLPNTAKQKISSHYTSPMKLFEYMAAERPIVAADLPSLREVINEKSALFFRPDSVVALVDGIKTLLSDNNLQHFLAQNAYNKVGGFSWDKRAEKIINFIQK